MSTERLRREMVEDANKVHKMMEELWCKFFDEGDMGWTDNYFVMDPLTYKFMQYSSEANKTCALNYFERPITLPPAVKGEAPLRWNDIKIILRTVMSEYALQLRPDANPCALHHEPFCMYLVVVKENGRHVYFDNGHTEKQYL